MRFDDYATDGFYDEMFTAPADGASAPAAAQPAPGAPREGYALLAQKLASLADGELVRRQASAEKALLDLGITFNVYGSDSGTEKIFPFDVVPRVVQASEWALIDRGLKQRIRALNLFIDDVYGAGRILADRVIPRELVLGASAYLAPCAGLRPPKGVWCHVVGTDLVRHADGQYYVLEDNLRCPSGVSYVLENRQIMKRTFPQVFEQSNVCPVDEYPSRLLETLRRLAPPDVEQPTVVLLSPGRYNSAYFEHSFLAKQMGVELVEGSDLVVRDGCVEMRTAKGVQRVHVIYRRIDDTFLDPLAFRRDSMLGVPGLMNAYRSGKVALANAPGNGIADDKVIYAYVPKMIRYYLGEDAILPNVETYVCADPAQREHVLSNIEQLVVKAANESGGYGMLVGPQATREERARFQDLIQENPRNYVAQPMLSLSRVPTLVDGALEGRHVDLRPYVLCADDVYVLPGGLTRVALKKGSCVVNSSQGGGSKDTWVLRAEGRSEDLPSSGGASAAPAFVARPPHGHEPVPGLAASADSRLLARLGPASTPTLSRVAEAVYWMSRYIERAENVARIVDVSLHLSLDLPSADAGQWAALVATTGDDALFRARHGEPERARVLEFLTFDPTYPSSVLSSLGQARENARSVREVISSEMWEQINGAYLMVQGAARSRLALETPHAFYAAVKQASHAFVGATDLTMTHNEAWHFARMGRLLERADKTSRMLDVRSYLLRPDDGAVLDESQWAALLKSASALEMYRKRHGLIEPLKVVDFLLLERQFPRAVLYCLGKAGRSLHAITGTALTTPTSPAERALGRLHAELEYAATPEIVARGLHEYIDELQTKLNALGDTLRAAFFAPPVDPARALAEAEAQQQQQQ